ncbi:MAG: metalloregulator ArsR/SmtB family transcription factor [Verrucomicrobiae bacterium]|nr:metalloregulator ArsR/SmtB family transcription factor [Verrucomicrobiae bacterium]
MPSTLKVWKILTDTTRLRVLALLHQEALTVSELQEILSMGQSRISTHLAQLRDSGLLVIRREGKKSFYSLSKEAVQSTIVAAALEAAREVPERTKDMAALKLILQKRKETARLFFNQVAGRFGRNYGPGRSWQAFAQMALCLMPDCLIADLGSGEGLVSQLLARHARKVIAVDNSDKMVAFGRDQARKNGIKNIEFRQGDLENPPVDRESVDVVLLSQALHHASNPERALQAAYQILKKGGRVLVLDLNEHSFDQARDLYGDHWLGFSQSDLHGWLTRAGFRNIFMEIVAREEKAPNFQTVLAYARK